MTDGLFTLLGLGTGAGRSLSRDDHDPGHSAVIMLDHAFWMREFGGEQSAFGEYRVAKLLSL